MPDRKFLQHRTFKISFFFKSSMILKGSILSSLGKIPPRKDNLEVAKLLVDNWADVNKQARPEGPQSTEA